MSCNCGNSSSSNPVCPTCQPDEYAMIPIERRNSNSACNDGSTGCSETHKWFDVTTSLFQVPSVSESVALNVCDPSRYSVGQWIFLSGGGRFYVVSVSPEAKTITVRNSCSDGESAITGNSTPGSAISQGSPLWVIDEPGWPQCISSSAQCAQVTACLASSESVCFTNIPEANDVDPYHLFGGSGEALCDPEGGDSGIIQSCLHKIVNIYTKAGALCYKARGSIGGNKVDVNGTDTPISMIVHDPSTKCDLPLNQLPADATGVYRYCNGNIVFNEGRLYKFANEKVYENLAYNINIGDSSFQITLSDVPSACSGNVIALIHVQVFATTNDSADFFDFSVEVGGEVALRFAGNEQYDAPLVVPFPAHNDNTIPVEIASNPMTVQVKVNNTTVDGTAQIRVWCRGFYF